MSSDAMEQLSAEVSRWRAAKRHPKEKTPERLVRRARRLAQQYGLELGRVSRVIGVDRRRLEGEPSGVAKQEEALTYSRVELAAPSVAGPFAELELPSGLRLRLYSNSPETMGLLSSVCAARPS